MEYPFGKSRTGIGWYLVPTWTIAQGIGLLEQVLSLELSNREKANVLALLGELLSSLWSICLFFSQLRKSTGTF